MNAKELFAAGQLSDSLQAALDEVRSAPGDIGRRWFLCELLCFESDWERADKQLETLAAQETSSAIQMSVGLFRQLIRAAISREEVFDQGRVPTLMPNSSQLLQQHLRSIVALRENEPASAGEILQELGDSWSKLSGKCDGQPFSTFRDLDDVTSCFFEVFTGGGDYCWLAYDQVSKLEFSPVERARDWLWRPAHLELRSGQPLEVFVPATYIGSGKREDEAVKLGRASDWHENETGPIQGLGVRMYLFGDEARTIHDITEIEFDQHG